VIGHGSHNQPVGTDKTANVIPQPLFLLARVVANAKPREGSGCLLSEPQPRSIRKARELTRGQQSRTQISTVGVGQK
jgi:hypothetical protein